MQEKIEYFRALLYSKSSDEAIAYLDTLSDETQMLPDWGRIVLSNSFSVGEGHRFGHSLLSLEVKEWQKIYSVIKQRSLRSPALIATLNKVPTRCLVRGANKTNLVIVGFGHWSRLYQHHVLHAVDQQMWFIKHDLGMAYRAQEYFDQMTTYFSDLTLFPLLEGQYQSSNEVLHKLANFCKDNYQWITFSNWRKLYLRFSKTPAEVKKAFGFFSFKFAKEPYFMVENARVFDTIKRYLNFSKRKTIHYWAPYCYPNNMRVFKYIYADEVTEKNVNKIFGSMTEYHTGVRSLLVDAYQDVPQKYMAIMKEICQSDPSQYIILADYLVSKGMKQDAAQAYQNAVDLMPDRVTIANNCSWLVNYYFDIGQKQKAMDIASMAADVYSYGGLQTMAKLLERMQKLEEAEQYYARIARRYNAEEELVNFYFRHNKVPNNKMISVSDNRLEYVAKKVNIVDLVSSAPISYEQLELEKNWGVKVWKVFRGAARAAGLEHDDIFLAVDGLRVYSINEWHIALSKNSKRSSVNLLVNRDGHIFKIKITGLAADRDLSFSSLRRYYSLKTILAKYNISITKDLEKTLRSITRKGNVCYRASIKN